MSVRVMRFVLLGAVVAAMTTATSSPTLAARECTITGTSGDDFLVGTPDADVICGLRGADALSGKGSSDRLFGGRGRDVLIADRGSDHLFGGSGDDPCLEGLDGEGNDVIDGGGGFDSYSRDRGDETSRVERKSNPPGCTS
jgi:Ca2+-binding RTX toxin-like protein